MAYLIGSFSSAVWIGRIFYRKDVRDYGSHNAGTTNTIRVLGLKPGIVVLALDAFKGWLAVSWLWPWSWGMCSRCTRVSKAAKALPR